MRLIALSASLCTLLFLAGCGATGTLTTTAASAPTILGTGLQTNGVATNREIDVKFSTAMDPSTITPKTFLLADAKGGASIAGAVAYDATNFVASFKATAPLDVNTSYNAAVTTGVASSAGVHLAANYAFSFVTRNTSDTSGIFVYETFPKDGQIDVAVNSNIQIVFSEGAASNTVNSQTFVVRDSSNNVIPGTVTYDILTNYATFTPSAPFLPGTPYHVVISGVTDLAGEPMPAAQAFSFTTAAVVVPLEDLVFEADVTTGTISGSIYTPSTNSIQQASSGPSGVGPVQLIPSPDGSTLYVVMGDQPVGVRGSNCLDGNTQVYSYAVDHTLATLRQESIIILSGFCPGASAAIDLLGRFLYVGEVDATASTALIDTISLSANGQMSLVSGSPFTSPQPITSLALSGSYLYGASNNRTGPDGLLTFQRDPATGSVQFVTATPLPPQDSVAVSPSGNTLYTVGTNTGLITEYQISAGALTQTGTVAAPPAPTSYVNFRLSVDPQGRYVGVGSPNSSTLYSVDAYGNIIPTGTIVLAPAPGTITFDTTGAAATVTEESTSGVYSVLNFYNFLGSTGIQYGNYTPGPTMLGPVTMFTK
jgi:6-phosphogluconolactonase (cycloisomerase 2 family)